MEADPSQEHVAALELQGSPHQRGVRHGEEFADEIRENVDTYLRMFAHYGAEEGVVSEKATEFRDLIESVNERYFAEMAGIADGADIELSDVALLNARYEVMYSAFGDAATGDDTVRGTDACTSFGIQPHVTEGEHTYLGQNWDWHPDINTFVMDVDRPGNPNFVAMTEAGIVGGKVGLNSHSIGMTLNGLAASSDGDNPYRKPYHVRFREVLDATRFDRAIGSLIATDRANSANVMLGHGEGELLDIEIAPETSTYMYPDDGILTHANHFEAAEEVESTLEKIAPDTLYRCSRLERLLKQVPGSIDLPALNDVLQDHFGHPASVCAHVDPGVPEPERKRTNGSFVMELDTGRMLATGGPPCETEYSVFEVSRTGS